MVVAASEAVAWQQWGTVGDGEKKRSESDKEEKKAENKEIRIG